MFSYLYGNKLYFHYVFLIFLIFIIIFLKIDTFPIRWWDESSFAINAYEFLKNGNFFIPYIEGQPDLFNLNKPPFTIWIQSIFIHLLGLNELAVRLPSALAASLTVLFLFHFTHKNFSLKTAWSSALILLSGKGFVDFHTSRTGDSDSMLTFFTFISNVFFLEYLKNKCQTRLLLFFIFLLLAFYTKTIAALFFIPSYIFLIVFYIKSFDKRNILKLILYCILFTICCLFLFVIREYQLKGYIEYFLKYEVNKAFYNYTSYHKDTLYYINNFIHDRWQAWFIPFVMSLFIFIYNRKNENYYWFCGFLLFIFSYLIVISLSSTKHYWYDMPLYPYLSFGSGITLDFLVTKLNLKRNTLLVIFMICSIPLYFQFERSQSNVIPQNEKYLEAKENYIFQRINNNKLPDKFYVYHSNYYRSLLFYKYRLLSKNKIMTITDNMFFNDMSYILVSDENLKRKLQENYHLKLVDKQDNAEMYWVKKK